MAMKVEVVQRAEEVAIYHCDMCGKRLGPAPIDAHGGYFLACSFAARDDKRPLWHGEFCRDCIDELRKNTGFDTSTSGPT